MGLVTVITALLKPREQSTVCSGDEGEAGCGFMVTLADEREVQPAELVTVKVYVPVASPVMFVVVPLPSVVTPPGFRLSVHVPGEGSPLKAALPAATRQVGWVIVPTTGAEGVGGCALITTLADESDVQPAEFVTVKV